MKQYLHKTLTLAISLATALSFSLGATAMAAGQLQNASLTMTDSRPGQTSSQAYSFHVAGTTAIAHINLTYAKTPSGAPVIPDGFSAAGATANVTVTAGGAPVAGWTSTVSGGNQVIDLGAQTTGILTSGATVSFTLNSIVNGAINQGTSCAEANGLAFNANADTCYVRITTYATADLSQPIDATSVSYTLVSPISVSATVDPILTFVVTGVTAANIAVNDPNATVAGGTPMLTTPTACGFGNITVGIPKLCQQDLNVLSNDQNGYTVFQQFQNAQSENAPLAGTYLTNVINTFTSNGATWSGTSATARVWAAPTGAKNASSAWIGSRTSNAGVTGFNNSDFYAPPAVVGVNAGTGNAVMYSTVPDNGSGHSYVTYKIGADAFQPSDTYTGIVTYNAVPTY